MKWPKSVEKIEIEGGGLEKLGGPPDGVPPLHMSGCATGGWGRFCPPLMFFGDIKN